MIFTTSLQSTRKTPHFSPQLFLIAFCDKIMTKVGVDSFHSFICSAFSENRIVKMKQNEEIVTSERLMCSKSKKVIAKRL